MIANYVQVCRTWFIWEIDKVWAPYHLRCRGVAGEQVEVGVIDRPGTLQNNTAYWMWNSWGSTSRSIEAEHSRVLSLNSIAGGA